MLTKFYIRQMYVAEKLTFHSIFKHQQKIDKIFLLALYFRYNKLKHQNKYTDKVTTTCALPAFSPTSKTSTCNSLYSFTFNTCMRGRQLKDCTIQLSNPEKVSHSISKAKEWKNVQHVDKSSI